VIHSVGQAHAHYEGAASFEIDLGLWNAAAFGAEPAFDMVGAAPRLEDEFARRGERAGDDQGLRPQAGGFTWVRHFRFLLW
jgi:hypothetical protein